MADRVLAMGTETTGKRQHCCDDMTRNVNHECDQHSDPFDCPDNLVHYSPKFDEYGIIIHDGGTSYILIRYCPWCGSLLPDSKRDRWFAELEEMGFDDPWEQDIPEQFESDAWYRS